MRVRGFIVVLAALLAPAAAHAAANPIVDENAQPGTDRWDLRAPPRPAIEGYASETSAAPGDAFHLHVRAPMGDRYRVLVYRLGWYGGDGGRLVACLPGCDSDEPAVAQPAAPPQPPDTGLVAAGWSVTDRLPVGSDWVSGYYLAVLRVTAGLDTGAYGRVPLVVRAASGDRAAILVQVPVNTWQAYNPWGGKSLYPFNSSDGVAAVKVSFDRPYSEAVPVAVPFELELPVLRFLEREGYDVSYVTDVDVDRTPAILLRHRLVVSIGHDEYWSLAMREAWDGALHRGTNLAVLGANAGYWHSRYEAGHRTLAEYRSAGADPLRDPAQRTVQFRALHPPRPECRVFGVQYEYYAQRAADQPPTPYTVAAASDDPWLRHTGLAHGDDVPGVVGYEWDGPAPGCFWGSVTPLFTSLERGADGRQHHAEAVRGLARSGARVLATGSLEFAWGLDAYGGHYGNVALQQLMRNALADLTRPARPRSLSVRHGHSSVALRATLQAPDPRVARIAIYRHQGGAMFDPLGAGSGLVCESPTGRCRDARVRGAVRYAAVAVDRWGRSGTTFSRASR